jgi:hypothetical protein
MTKTANQSGLEHSLSGILNSFRASYFVLRVSALVLFGCSAFCSLGCQTITPKNWNIFGGPKIKDSKYAVPARIAIMWSPAILNQAGKIPTRGFGGRVYFYDAKNTPVPVEGQLVIYAYNNDKPNPDSKVPDRKYAFTPEQFASHYMPTELGASYSIWVPWDEAGQPQAEISLVPVFTSTSGALVMGQPSRNLLPGPKSPEPTSYITNCTLPPGENQFTPTTQARSASEGPRYERPNYAVQQTSFAAHPAAVAAPHPAGPGVPQFHGQSGLSTMSITMPGTMADRLASATPQISLMQRMAQLRQEALARQHGTPNVGWAVPTANGQPGVVRGSPDPAPTAPAGVPQPWFPAAPQPARSAPPAPPVPNGPTPPQAVGPPPSQQFPAARPSAPPGSLESAQLATTPESWSAATKTAR